MMEQEVATTTTTTRMSATMVFKFNDSKFETATSGLLLRTYDINLLRKQSNQNASTILDYLLAINEETNPSSAHKRSQIVTLTQLSESCKQETFLQIKRDDVLA